MQEIQLTERVILSLGDAMSDLGKAVLDLELPGRRAEERFEELVSVIDVDRTRPPQAAGRLLEGGVRILKWPVEEEARPVERGELDLFRGAIDGVDYFERAKFKVVRGLRVDDQGSEFETDLLFKALARRESGELLYLSGHLHVLWARHHQGSGKPDWLVRAWTVEDLTGKVVDEPLFDEVLDRVLPDRDVRHIVRRSIHEEKIVDLFREGGEGEPWFTGASWDRHPGLSVVDVDGDGWDDLYLMARWGANVLLRNRGDGTFEERASELGLAQEDHTSSAIFADFDNDGDPDAFLGRTLAQSLYLNQEDGQFVDRSDRVEGELPYLVSSVSAVDYDRDGLLDVYLSTYAAAMIQRQMGNSAVAPTLPGTAAGKGGRLLPEFLSDEDSKRLAMIYDTVGHPILDRPGPPNLLLHNEGDGRFRPVRGENGLEVWRNTYQSSWADIDGDGDPDVYLANDFAPNNLFRNDGEGRFVDVTRETEAADIGFGMGVSFGDLYDVGRQDIYVSNMFTKAGRRITAQAAELDPRFALMTRGNSLLRNTESGVFERVSGLEPPALLVEAAGWAWGGQFADLDNDTRLDVYSPSGYYTAPDEIAIPVDT